MTGTKQRFRATRKRRSDGARTRAAILDAAARLASIEGLTGVTIGRLADTLGVSKSGLYAHFGSKEQLQLATVEAAEAIMEREVLAPASAAPDGLPRLEKLAEAYFAYVERWVFPGGCFFTALLADMDARSGPVHDLAVGIERAWLQELARLVSEAQTRGEVSARADPHQLAFEIHAYFELANLHFVLLRDPVVLERGRRAVARILQRARTEG